MKLHALIHGSTDGLGKIADWAARRGHSVTQTQLYAGEVLPEAMNFDLLVIMGGGMNIYQHRDHPWLVPEKRFIREAIERGKKVLGVCLGGQLIADVLGAKIVQNPVKEIGWWSVRTVSRNGAFAELPERMTVFHWHGDTFEIPPGATRVAESDACANQAFVFGECVVGLQFHIEVAPDSVAEFIAGGESEMIAGPSVQPPEQVLKPPAGFDPSVLGSLLTAIERAT
jgi:GMP synthase (glutamine-hydrolysing)